MLCTLGGRAYLATLDVFLHMTTSKPDLKRPIQHTIAAVLVGLQNHPLWTSANKSPWIPYTQEA